MGLNLALSTAGNWRSVYARTLIGSATRQAWGIPLIDPEELPFTLESRIIGVSATYLQAKPSWNAAGYFYQEVDVPLNDSFTFPGMGSPNTTLDGGRRYIPLNSNTLCIFNRLATEHRYRFEAMPWIPKLNLAIWEYIGPDDESTEVLIEALTLDVSRLETKIDAI